MLKPPTDLRPEDMLDHFLEWTLEQGIELYDHQEEAILEIFEGRHVILNTPTGSGKSLVALAMQFRALCLGRVAYYTVPIKALANEKFLSLCKTFGADQVGLITGDATVNPEAPLICCTAEILSNLALRDGSRAAVNDVIIDEFHYYSDPERGVAWQIPLLTLPQCRFLLMSATLGDTEFFLKELEKLSGVEASLVKSDQRPVPLHFEYSETILEEKVEALAEAGKTPIYLVNFTQLACAKTAQDLLSRNFCSKDEKKVIAEELESVNFNSPYGKELKKILRHGIGIHHAGLLPKYRLAVEKLAQQGLLKVICGTDTLGVGINVPIRTVVFTQLCKYDGSGTRLLTVRDFKQICGRAGRRGFDEMGDVVCQAPQHAIENKKLEEKAAAGKKKKFIKKKAPERGYVHWDEETFLKLQNSPSEKLQSSFKLSHSLLLNLLGREYEDGCEALKRLIASSHETEVKQAQLRHQARRLFMSLVRGRVLTIIPPAEREGAVKVRLHWDLQQDFTMNQALSLFLLDTLAKLEAEQELGEAMEPGHFTLMVITLIESILENPYQILRAQTQKAKDALVAEMKEDGSSYEERMEALMEVTWPKPNADFVYSYFNQFIPFHPYLGEDQIRPKSIAREMLEEHMDFDEYIRRYGLEKSEAILLRHLTEVYKVLDQTIPKESKTPELLEAENYFRELLEKVDSSLLDEWRALGAAEG